jgi:gas vesicle structural protein
MTMVQSGSGYLDRPKSSSLADVVAMILDKGLVIDVYVRVSLVGIELITIDARIVIASVDTYLRFAEATNRLDLSKVDGKPLPEYLGDFAHSGAKGKTGGALEGVKEAFRGHRDDDDDDDDEREAQPQRSRRSNSS